VNAEFSGWSAPAAVPDGARGAVEAAVAGALGAGLTRDRDGSTAYVLSFGNAGKAREQGVEIGVGYALSGTLRLDANGSWYGFDVDQSAFQLGDTIQANTPPWTANVALSYGGVGGRRVRVGLRWEDAYAFRSGLWRGQLPSALSLDVNAGGAITSALSWSVSATNVLNQERFHLMGGSVIGRRALVTMVWRP
jgi:outer membrane receptor protein involved in Fe transport